jgi:hypothetical protein
MKPSPGAARSRFLRAAAVTLPAAVAVLLTTGTAARANVTVTQVSSDPYTDAQAQHRTEVEPDTFAFGSTIVSAFQVGRVSGGGSSNIGWARSGDGGATWTHGFLPGITTDGGGTFGQASDASVAFDARHNVWLYLSLSDTIRSFRSTNGGTSWSSTVQIAAASHHTVAGNLREEILPSAEADAAGTVYVTWSDCRFRSGCPGNDIVLAKSTSETTWAAPVRVPIDATSSTADHFIPGVGVDPSTSGASARIGLTYYFYPTAACTASTCRLDAGFISSVNGGASWGTATQLAGPMNLTWIPNTSQGRMFGDYISTSVLPGGNAYPIIPVGNAPTGSTFDLAMYAPTGGLPVTGGTTTARGVLAAALPSRSGNPSFTVAH